MEYTGGDGKFDFGFGNRLTEANQNPLKEDGNENERFAGIFKPIEIVKICSLKHGIAFSTLSIITHN